ncbi:MAG: hypothetical protein PSX37_13265, partial [bacterium]|nr:hypothetical protein [bacterium]
MTTWACRVAGESGSTTIDAPDRASAARALMARGSTPLAIEPLNESVSAGSRGEVRTGRTSPTSVRSAMSRSETAMFIRELATAIIAGLPLTQALRTLGSQGRSTSQ